MLKEKIITKNQIQQKKQKSKLKKILATLIAGIFSFSAISIGVVDQTEKKINEVPVEKIEKFKKIISVVMDDQKFYDYISNFHYTDKMHKEDLTTFNTFKTNLLKKYRETLSFNTLHDDRSDDEIIFSMTNNFGEMFSENFIYYYQFQSLKRTKTVDLFENVYFEYTDQINYAQKIKKNFKNRTFKEEYNNKYSMREQYFKNIISSAIVNYAKYADIQPNYYSFLAKDYKSDIFYSKSPYINKNTSSVMNSFKQNSDLIRKDIYDQKISPENGAYKLHMLRNAYINHSFNSKDQINSFLKLTRIGDSVYKEYESLKEEYSEFNNEFALNNIFVKTGVFIKTRNLNANSYSYFLINNDDIEKKMGVFRNKKEVLLHLSGYSDGIIKYTNNYKK